MPLSAEDALKYVKPLTMTSKKELQKFVVSDFARFPGTTKGKATHAAYQAVWARHLAFAAATATQPSLSMPNGGKLSKALSFSYDEGKNDNVAPTVKGAKDGGKIVAEIIGAGECAYFASRAFQDLKSGKALKGKTAPLIEQVADPSVPHNFCMVNRDAPDQADWVMVDYWLYALGIPWEKCVCQVGDVPDDLAFYSGKLRIINTYDPNK